MSINAISSSPAVHQPIPATKQKAAAAQPAQPAPKHDTVHISSTATGDVDHDGDSH